MVPRLPKDKPSTTSPSTSTSTSTPKPRRTRTRTPSLVPSHSSINITSDTPDKDTASVLSDHSYSASAVPSPLKPKTAGARVEKSKALGGVKGKGKASSKKEKEKEKEGEDKFEIEVRNTSSGKVEKKVASGGGKEKIEGKKGEEGKKGDDAKIGKVTGEEAEKVILAYLREQNRPYSVTEVVANLRGRVGKTVADKILKELEQSGKITGKASNGEKKPGEKKGAQWVFWCLQDATDAATPAELTAMDHTISSLRSDTIPLLKANLKTLTTHLSAILSTPTTSDLHVLLTNLQASNAEKRERLKGYKEGSVKMVMKEEKEGVEKEWKYWKQKREIRKRGYEGVEGVLREGMSREEIWEKCGVEDGDAWLKG